MDRVLLVVGAVLFAGSFACDFVPSPGMAVYPAALAVEYGRDTVTVRGSVPTEGDRDVVLRRAEVLLPGKVLVDRLNVRAVRSGDWLRTSAIDAALQQAFPIGGVAELADSVLRLSGTVATDSLKRFLIDQARRTMTAGMVLDDRLIVVPAPVRRRRDGASR